MSTPIRIGGSGPQLVTLTPSGAVAQVSFASRLQSAVAAPAGGITGRQVVAAALSGITPPRSMVSMVARAVGGPVGMVAAAVDHASDQAQLLDMLDKTKQILLTNSIFDTANAPTVERELETGI